MKKACLLTGAALFAAGLCLKYLTAYETLSMALLLVAYGLLGAEIIWDALRHIAKGKIFDENFLMSIATIGALALGDWAEAAAVMLFYRVGEYFQDKAVARSKRSIATLMDIRPDYANLKTETGIARVAPEQVTQGDLVVVKPGEKIPLDGVVVSGSGLTDARSLTGESLPVAVGEGDTVLSGCVSLDAMLTLRVTKAYGESTVSKILNMVENASAKKAQTERFITTFARYYTPVVVALAVLLAVVPPLFFGDFGEWLHRALVFLVITCPCAVVISVPLGYFAGIGAMSRRGVLVKGSQYVEALGEPDIVVFDKTGTLTQGALNVTEITCAEGFSEKELLHHAALAESFSSHPIGVSIVRAYGGRYGETIDSTAVTRCEEKAGFGVSAEIGGRQVLAGGERLLASTGVSVPACQVTGTAVHIAVEGRYAGHILVGDTLRPKTRETVDELKRLGARRVVMLTGDSPEAARPVAESLGIEAYARLLPHEKVEKLEALEKDKRPGGALLFVGDGINDAPVLARADVGVAMGGLGSDAAIEAADIVLMTDEPFKLAQAVGIAKKTRRVVRQNIVFALSVKLVIMTLGALGMVNMWAAVFADVGVSLIAIFNALRAARNK